jgi:hypothetical protein
MTGQDLDCNSLACLRKTFTAILAKPVDPRRLLALLAELLPPIECGGSGDCLP